MTFRIASVVRRRQRHLNAVAATESIAVAVLMEVWPPSIPLLSSEVFPPRVMILITGSSRDLRAGPSEVSAPRSAMILMDRGAVRTLPNDALPQWKSQLSCPHHRPQKRRRRVGAPGSALAIRAVAAPNGTPLRRMRGLNVKDYSLKKGGYLDTVKILIICQWQLFQI